MSKFVSSEEAIPSELMLWSTRSTQTGVKDIKQVDYYPINSFANSDTINFDIPGQPNLMLKKVEIVSKVNVTNKDGSNLTATDQVSIVSNFGHSLWKLVDVTLNSRVSIMSPMHQSYNLEAFFDTIVNEDPDRVDKLFRDQCFLLDDATSKEDSESVIFSGDNIKNPSAATRAKRISTSKDLTIITDLHCSLFKQRKVLPTNLDIAISLTKNDSSYVLLHADDEDYIWNIEKVFLRVTYVQPQDFLLNIIEDRLRTSPAIYECNKSEISTFAIPTGITSYVFNNIFRGSMPHFIIFAIQDRDAIAGQSSKNPFTFHPFKAVQLYVNNREYFPEPLEGGRDDFTLMFNHLYKATGYDVKGSCLISPQNFLPHYMLATALSRDRTVKFHHNIQDTADFKANITFDKATGSNLILVVYSVHDRIIRIDSDRNVELI